MTADNLLLLVLTLLLPFGLSGAIFYLGRKRLKGEWGPTIAAVSSIAVLFLGVFLLSFALNGPDTAKGMYAALSRFLGEPRWYHALLLAAVGGAYTAGSAYGRYRPADRLFSVFLYTFTRNSVHLLILYFLYALTGSLPLTGVAAAASVVLWLIIRYSLRRMYSAFDSDRLSDGWLNRIRRLLYLPITLLPSAISLLTFVLLYRQPRDEPTAPDSPDLIWPLVLFFLLAAVNFTVFIKDMSRARGGKVNDEYARSRYVSLIRVSLVRIFVLALFVIPAGLAAGGGWRAGAFTALFGYALLELCVSGLHARAAAQAFRLMSAGE